VHWLDQLRAAGDTSAWTIVATAHPAKFDSVVEPLIGHQVDVPNSLAAMLSRQAMAEPLAANDNALKAWLSSH